MPFEFKKATKEQSKGRIALIGPAGSGKTYSALSIGAAMGSRVAVVDTEHGSARKYADKFSFDVLELDSFSPTTYMQAIRAAEDAGYEVLVIDSLSHAWMGKDGALEMVDQAAKRNHGNSFAGWRDVTPMHNALIDVMIASKLHLIVTMRSKTEWVMEEDSRGKKVPKKIGLAPIQKDGLEYEFDVVGDIDLEHSWIISKTRCSAFDGRLIALPGEAFARSYMEWLCSGAVPAGPPVPVGQPDTRKPAPEPQRSVLDTYVIPKGVHAGKALDTCPTPYLMRLARERATPEWLRDRIDAILAARDQPSSIAALMQASIDAVETAKAAAATDPLSLETVDNDTGEVEASDPWGLGPSNVNAGEPA